MAAGMQQLRVFPAVPVFRPYAQESGPSADLEQRDPPAAIRRAPCRSMLLGQTSIRNLKTARHSLRRLGAPKYPHASLESHFVNEDPPAKLRMPGIKYFPLFGPVGVMLSSCTTAFERTDHWPRIRRSHGRFSRSDASCPMPWSVGCTTNTSKSRFSAHTVMREELSEDGAVPNYFITFQESRWT
jgi:hypothetical protein